jgi:hypothetical protein
VLAWWGVIDAGYPGCALRFGQARSLCAGDRLRRRRCGRRGPAGSETSISTRDPERTGDPGKALFRLNGGEHPYLARCQETNRFHGKPDPADIGDDRDPLATRGMLQPEIEIVPCGTGKSRAELVIRAESSRAACGISRLPAAKRPSAQTQTEDSLNVVAGLVPWAFSPRT